MFLFQRSFVKEVLESYITDLFVIIYCGTENMLPKLERLMSDECSALYV